MFLEVVAKHLDVPGAVRLGNVAGQEFSCLRATPEMEQHIGYRER